MNAPAIQLTSVLDKTEAIKGIKRKIQTNGNLSMHVHRKLTTFWACIKKQRREPAMGKKTAGGGGGHLP